MASQYVQMFNSTNDKTRTEADANESQTENGLLCPSRVIQNRRNFEKTSKKFAAFRKLCNN